MRELRFRDITWPQQSQQRGGFVWPAFCPLYEARRVSLWAQNMGTIFLWPKGFLYLFLIFATEAFLAVQKVDEVPSALALFPNLWLSQVRLAGCKTGPICKYRANLIANVNVSGNTWVAMRQCYNLLYCDSHQFKCNDYDWLFYLFIQQTFTKYLLSVR